MHQLFLLCATILVVLHNGVESTTGESEHMTNFEKCVAKYPPIIVGEDFKWMTRTWEYYMQYSDEVFLSRLIDLLLLGQEHRPLEELRCLWEIPCLTTNNSPFDGSDITENFTAGCNGLKVPFTSALSPQNHIDSILYYPNNHTAVWPVKWQPALTDRETYLVLISCLPDGEYGFQVFSVVPEISPSSMVTIKQFLEKHGFDVLGARRTYKDGQCTNHPRMG